MDPRLGIIMEGVKEYNEGDDVSLMQGKDFDDGEGSLGECPKEGWIVVARNEGGYNSTGVDLAQLIAWLRKNRPDLLQEK